jgi:hypothetical protein
MREKLRRLLPIKKMGVMPEKLESLEGFCNVLVGIAEGNGRPWAQAVGFGCAEFGEEPVDLCGFEALVVQALQV